MNLRAFRTLFFRECHRFLRLANQTIIPPMITSSLYILIFGNAIGSRISSLGGVPYLDFIIPGLVMMGVISSAYSNTSSSLYTAKFHGSIQELLVSSMSNFEIVLAIILGGVARGLSVGICIIAISMLFTDTIIFHLGITFFFIISVAFLFSCAGFISGIWADSFDRLTLFQTYCLTPLIYLGGVFFSLDMLPHFWRGIARINPIFYLVDGIRFGYLGISDINLSVEILLVLLLSLIMFVFCYSLFKVGYKIKS